jgi:hypothetical protein
MVRTGWVFSGRLGEVGIGVVCKVLSGRHGSVRCVSVRIGGAVLGRFGRAGYGRIGFGVI